MSRPPHPSGVGAAVLTVTLLALVDVSAGPTVVLAAVMTVGPCLAAIAGSPRAVGGVGAYSIGLLLLLSWPDRLWWTRQQLYILLALVAVTAVSIWAAERRRRDAEQLRAVEAESIRARAVSEATGEFLSRVSHELRTPLNAVLGFTQLLQREDLTPDQHETTDQVALAGRHLLALVNDVLDLTSTEAGRLSLSVEPVAVGEVVLEAVELTASAAAARSIQLRADLGEAEDWYVLADARRLRQVLLNLLSNAVKFNSPDGAVDIRVEHHAEGGISISVRDTGRGIAPPDLDKLFRPFERLDAATAGIEGSGLGLALSRGLTEAMDGTLSVVSPDRIGTTFTITLPVATATAITHQPVLDHPPASIRPTPEGTPARVLYVEDNLSNLRLVERILELRPEWVVTHAPGGASGLALALATRFDLVLLDQNLPDLHGLDILRELRSHERYADLPVVMVSADASPGQVQRARAAGATDYLVKPFTIDGLLAVLDAHAPAP